MSPRDVIALGGAVLEGVRLARQIARETSGHDASRTLETLRKTVATVEGRQQLRDWLTTQAQAAKGQP